MQERAEQLKGPEAQARELEELMHIYIQVRSGQTGVLCDVAERTNTLSPLVLTAPLVDNPCSCTVLLNLPAVHPRSPHSVA
jgi:hypothetical protein